MNNRMGNKKLCRRASDGPKRCFSASGNMWYLIRLTSPTTSLTTTTTATTATTVTTSTTTMITIPRSSQPEREWKLFRGNDALHLDCSGCGIQPARFASFEFDRKRLTLVCLSENKNSALPNKLQHDA